MKETEKRTGRRSPQCHSGFVSAYFLSVFLYLSLYCGVLAVNLKNRSEVMLNLKQEQEYFLEESPAVRQLMCDLAKQKAAEDEAKEDEEEESDSLLTGYEISGNTVLLSAAGPYPVQILAVYDPETYRIVEIQSLRSEP